MEGGMEKPSRNEDEYFTRLELEKKKQWEKERTKNMGVAEKEKLREMHHMKCPKCGMDLHSIEFHGVSIDRCVSCNGTWLDAGEMEQLTASHGLFGKVMGIFK